MGGPVARTARLGRKTVPTAPPARPCAAPGLWYGHRPRRRPAPWHGRARTRGSPATTHGPPQPVEGGRAAAGAVRHAASALLSPPSEGSVRRMPGSRPPHLHGRHHRRRMAASQDPSSATSDPTTSEAGPPRNIPSSPAATTNSRHRPVRHRRHLPTSSSLPLHCSAHDPLVAAAAPFAVALPRAYVSPSVRAGPPATPRTSFPDERALSAGEVCDVSPRDLRCTARAHRDHPCG